MLIGRNLYKVYKEGRKEVSAVRDVSLEVRRPEILGIIGPSGAGKSTLLHLLGGLDRPSSGKVELDGVDLYNISDDERSRIRNRRLGFVFQFYHLLPEMTAIENVMLPAMIYGLGKAASRGRAKRLLETVGLAGRLDHKPSRLSGGESQRVAIARSLVNGPEIVLCDEPTGNLDSEMSGELFRLIRNLSRENEQAFVVVTHEPAFAKTADRVLHIKDGTLK